MLYLLYLICKGDERAMFDYTREQIINALNNHPKESAVKITPDRVEEMKKNPLLEEAFATLEKAREFYRDRPLYAIPFSMLKRYEADGDRTEFEYAERGYFMHRGHLKTWGLSTLFYGDENDIKMLEDTIWAICDEYTWSVAAHMNGNHGIYVNYQPDRFTIDLFAAETGQAIAEILQIVGDKLNPLVVQRAKREIKRRIIDRFIDGELSDFWWANGTNNWAAVCAGSVGMAAICELDDNERLATMIEKNLASMRTFMSGFSDDGACLEGIGYWSYGFGYFSYYADMLYKRTGGEINLFDDDKVRLVATFPTKMFLYGSRTVGFSDAGSRGGIGLGIVNKLMEHCPDMVIPASASMSTGVEVTGCHRFASNLRSFLWAGAERPGVSEELKIYALPDAQWFIGNGSDNFGIAAKAGNNGEPHNHNDLGNFEVFKNGEEFFADLGSGEYNKAYFGSGRYQTWHCGSQGHSVPIINGKTQCAGKDRRAERVSVDERGIRMDITKAYDVPELTSINRSFEFSPNPARVVLKDEFKFVGAIESLVERFVTRIKPNVKDGMFMLENDKGTVSLRFEASAFDVMVTPVEVGDHMGRPFTFYTVDLIPRNPKKEMSFEFVIE